MSWIATYTGREVYPLDLKPDDIDIRDVAHALSNICRFTGHTRQFYSVAEHSVIVSQILSPMDALCGLLHDATEAYLCDLVRPIKRILPEYTEAEDRAWQAIAVRFGLPAKLPTSVQHADIVALATERRDLVTPTPSHWHSVEGVQPLEYRIEGWLPQHAERDFLHRFTQLTA